MEKYIKKNINILLGIFLLIQPILDLITGLSLRLLNINLTIGIIIRILFLIFIMFIGLFIYKKKKLLYPYIIIFIYSILYIIGIVNYQGTSNLFVQIQGLIKVMYYPMILITLYSIKEHINISKTTLLTVLITYLLLIFVPTLFNVGFNSYQITRVGTLGFFNSANEISGIISIITPFFIYYLLTEKTIIKKIIIGLIFLVVIVSMGTKTPLLALGIVIGMTLIYLWFNFINKKEYKKLLYSLLILTLLILLSILLVPKTNFYKNIEKELDYIKVDNVIEVFESDKLIDHAVFGRRLSFLEDRSNIFSKSNTYEKLFGIGYYENNKLAKQVEIDYFDIMINHGLIGFMIVIFITVFVLMELLRNHKKINLENYLNITSILLIFILAGFTGHIITAPAVSFISVIVILMLFKKDKKELLFASYSLELGGIEKALVNLVNRIDLNKYNITIILEEKKGVFLKNINKNIIVKELKVSNNKNIFIRKIINYSRKLIYSILYKNSYDFSCCYATYSYSSSKIALLSSKNNSIYIHSTYKNIYKTDAEYKNFFDTRNIYNYNNILFVSNESKKEFISIYKNLKDKCIVLNNFVDTNEIIKLCNEQIDIKRKKEDIILVFVGRLDETSKRITKQIKLVENIKDIKLWIIGDGPDKDKYIKEVKEKDLEDRIIFFGKKDNPYPYMKKADYIILTSDYEGFPVTYLEAITLDKKIITTFPTSDDKIDLKNIAYIISKDEDKMIKEVKEILKENKKVKTINIEKHQEERIKELYKIFDEVV